MSGYASSEAGTGSRALERCLLSVEGSHPRLAAIDTKQVTPITMEQAVQVDCLLSAQTSLPANQRHERFETVGDQLSRPFRVDRVEAHYWPGR